MKNTNGQKSVESEIIKVDFMSFGSLQDIRHYIDSENSRKLLEEENRLFNEFIETGVVNNPPPKNDDIYVFPMQGKPQGK